MQVVTVVTWGPCESSTEGERHCPLSATLYPPPRPPAPTVPPPQQPGSLLKPQVLAPTPRAVGSLPLDPGPTGATRELGCAPCPVCQPRAQPLSQKGKWGQWLGNSVRPLSRARPFILDPQPHPAKQGETPHSTIRGSPNPKEHRGPGSIRVGPKPQDSHPGHQWAPTLQPCEPVSPIPPLCTWTLGKLKQVSRGSTPPTAP